jgi:DNA repair protein RadC
LLISLKESPKRILESRAAAEVLRNILSMENEVDRDKEHFWVIGLNTKSTVLYVELVSLGTLTNTLIHPREVFRMAIFKAACRIMVGHNHPSGSLELSPEDRAITRRLRQAGEILGIQLLDHIIIGNNNPEHYSFQGNLLL